MLKRMQHRGFTMVELLTAIVLLALVLAIGGPSFATWLQNSQIRNASEAIKDGLQVARAEAVRRNARVRLQFVDNLTNSCALSTSGRNWVVSMDSAVGACASTNMADDAAPAAPRIVQTRAGGDGSSNAVIAADQSSIEFNGLGRVATAPAANIVISVTNPTGGACAISSGPMRCLQVVVTPAGQIRMCDPRSGFGAEGC
jgi:type IV fimbrial biogenesis protein FimT